MQPLPDNKDSSKNWRNRDLAYKNIYDGLIRLFPALTRPPVLLREQPQFFQVPARSENYIERQIFRDAKRLLLEQRRGQITTNITALYGMGGFGKTALVLALCHDPEIKEAFDNRIFWVDELGEQPPDELDLLNRLLVSFEKTHGTATTLPDARARWRTALDEQVCLLVIDDLWPRAKTVLDTLLEGRPQCVRLITTRDRQVLPERSEQREVDAMELEEAVDVFYQGLAEEKRQQADRTTVQRLVRLLNCWPLLLKLAHGLVISLVDEYKETITEALRIIEQAYEMQGVVAFDSSTSNRKRTITACLEISLRHLEGAFAYEHYDPVERYEELAIFPEGVDIPIVTLQTLWKSTKGLELWQTKIVCRYLHKLSLLLTCNFGETGTIRLHNVMHSYLQQRIGKEKLKALHQRLLDAYTCQRWAELPRNEPYLWQHLARHLIGAGRGEEFVMTVKDGGYLAIKTKVCSVYAIESDINISIRNTPTDTTLRLLKRHIACISHLLKRCESPEEAANVLHSRLSQLPELSRTWRTLEKEARRPFLTSWYPFPELSDPALMRTLQGHENKVRGCAVDPEGKFIVSASSDTTLKVWHSETGSEQHTLKGHTGEVHGCAVSPLGNFIVSASSDKTLKIWERDAIKHMNMTWEIAGCIRLPLKRLSISQMTT